MAYETELQPGESFGGLRRSEVGFGALERTFELALSDTAQAYQSHAGHLRVRFGVLAAIRRAAMIPATIAALARKNVLLGAADGF
jgi:hypothetical protein